MSAVADSHVSPDGGGGGGGGSGDEPAAHPAAHENRDASAPGQVTIELPERGSTATAADDDDVHHHDSGHNHCSDNDDAGAKAAGHGHSHGGHGHSHGGHGHSHGGHGKSDEKCEWNYINIIIAVFCTILLALLLGLLIFWLVLNTGPVKTYYIGIENVEWSYTPRGNLCGSDVNSTYSVFADGSAADRVGATYRKARYVQYTDETFTTRTSNDSEAVGQLGILGPVLRASVGETLRVYVRNDASFPFSINPWGLRIAKASEGAGYDDSSFFFEKYEDSIAPLAINQYTCTGFGIDQRTGCRPFLVHPGQYLMQDWPVTKEAGPQDGDGNSVLWLYTSDVDGQIEAGINAGLVGAIIIDAAEADADASLPAPGLEFVNVFLSSDENESPYLDMNMWEHVVEASYGHVVAGWVPFGFLNQADVLRGLYARAVQSAKAANPDATGAPEQLSYAAAATLVNTSIASHSPVASAEGVVIGVQFTDPTNNPADSNSFDPATFNGRYGDGAAQQVVHALFARALDELKNDEAFKASNVVKTINGLAFCNQPGLDVSVTNQDTVSQNSCDSGDDCVVRWWTSAVGGEDSLHVPTWSGGLGTADLDAQVISGSTSVVDTTVGAMQAGTWVFGDGVVANAAAGAQSHFTVNNGADNLLAEARAAGNVVEVAIKAVQVQWDYLPGTEATSNCEVDQGAAAPSQFAPSKFSVGSNYSKWRFVQCVDLVCSDTVDPADWQGITGPPLYVEEGQLLRVTLFNDVTEDITLVASGLLTENATAAVAATPSGSAVFEFYAPASASASALAAASASAAVGNSRAWVYHGSTEGQIHAGLLGGVVVVDAGQTDSATGLPDGTDHEFVLFLGNSDENLSPLAAENAVAGLTELRAALGALGDAEFAEVVARVARTNSDLTAGNVMAGVNGRALCTLEGLSAAPGQAVRFHLVGPPTDGTVHSGRVAGHDITVAGHRQQTASLFPGSAVSFTVVARSGDWEVSDGAAGFFNAGVRAEFKVSGGAADVAEGTKATRTFYLAADEVEWDYAPSGYNKCQHTDFSAAEDSAKYMLQGTHRIGRKYVKAQYRRYLNENFDTLQSGTVSRGNSASQHLGLLGTVMTAEVGDTLVVYFKNNLRFPANVVLPGPFQSAARAEQVHVDGTLGAELAGDNTLKPVAPGETVKYTWVVAEDMGPAAGDSNSVVYSYGAQVFDKAQGVTPEAMANAGLVGALIVVRAGELKSSQTMPKDINVEFIVLTGVLDENLSPYLRLNAQRYADDPFTIDYADPEFQESNRMRSINGLMFCNGEGWVANLFQTVRFYVLGTDSGIHALNLHGQSIINAATKRNSFSASVAAGGTATGDSQLSSPGHWLLESSISTNTLLGAQEMFTVHPQVTQFLKQTAGGFHQRDSRQPTNFDNSVRGQS